MKKKNWMQIHTYLSLFFLPVALIYALTGVLYIFEIRQDSGARIHTIPLESAPEKGKEQEIILSTLKENNLKIPKNTKVTNFRGNMPRMGNVYYDVVISQDKNGAMLRATQRNLYGVLMLMHKSVGTKFQLGSFRFSLFDFIAIGFGISLVIFYLSGLIVTSFCKRNRKAAFGILGVGLIITILAVYFSV